MSNRMTSEQVVYALESSPFISFLGLRLEEMSAQDASITLSMPLREEMERGGPLKGQFHGGPVAALVDTAADFAVSIAVGGAVPTINFRIDYLRPSSGELLIAKAKARKVGRTVSVVDVDVFNDQGKLTAVGRGTFGSFQG